MASKTLYVGNIPYTTTEGDLTKHFSTYGASNARIIEGRGFGFVDINEDQLEIAIADKNNGQLDGRTLSVSEAKPREKRSDSGSRPYGSGYGGGKSRGHNW